MAFITEDQLGLSSGQDSLNTVNALPVFRPKPVHSTAAPTLEKEKPGFLDTTTAILQQNHTLGSLYENTAHPFMGKEEIDPTFSPRRVAVTDGLAEYQDEFTGVRNREEYDFVKNKVMISKQAKQTISDAGGWAVAGGLVTAAFIDPIGVLSMAVPIAGAGRIATIANPVLRFGASATATTGTLAAGIGATALLTGASRPITSDENVAAQVGFGSAGLNVAAAAGIGMAMFGSIGRAASKASKTQVTKAIDSLLVDPAGVLLPANATAAQKAAATALDDAGNKLYMNAGMHAVEGMTKLSGGVIEGIGMKLAKSPYAAMRQWGQQIAPDILQRVETKAGVAAPQNIKLMAQMESNADIHTFNNDVIGMVKGLDSLKTLTPADQLVIFNELKSMGITAKSIDDITPATVQTYARELVGHAVATGNKHVVPEIEQAAGKLRGIFDKDWQRINAQGLATAASQAAQNLTPTYFTRVFKKEAIATDQLRWIGDVSPHIEQSLLANGVPAADAIKQAEMIAIAAANKIMGMSSAGTGADLMAAMVSSGPMGKLAARTLDVPHSALSAFLEHDAVKVLQTYKRSVEPQLALKEIFGHTNFGDFKAGVMTPEFDRLKSAMIERAKTTTDPTELAVINAEIAGFDVQWKTGADTLETLFDGVLGKSKMSEKAHTDMATAARVLRKTAGLAMLSGQVLSSFPDIARVGLTHGFAPTLGAWGNYLTSKAFRSMSKETSERVGVALELTMNKLKIHADNGLNGYERELISQKEGILASLDRGTNTASEKFQWLNGAMAWNDILRSTTASLAEDRLLRAAITDFAKLSRTDREWLAVMGVDDAGLKAIGAASQGTTSTTGWAGKFMSTSLDQWTDLDAARTFKLAILKDASTTALTPFQGTLPGWYDSEVGKFIWQFKSFVSAGAQQTLMVGLQRNDARTWMGVTGMIATAMAVTAIKDNLSGKSETEPKSWKHYLVEGVDKSGVFDAPMSLLAYADAAQSLVTGRNFGQHLGFNNNDRRPQTWDALTGPSVGLINRAAGAIKGGLDGDLNEQDQQKVMSVMPFHKMLGFDVGRTVIDAVHGHTQYMDKVVGSFKSTFPNWEWDMELPEAVK